MRLEYRLSCILNVNIHSHSRHAESCKCRSWSTRSTLLGKCPQLSRVWSDLRYKKQVFEKKGETIVCSWLRPNKPQPAIHPSLPSSPWVHDCHESKKLQNTLWYASTRNYESQTRQWFENASEKRIAVKHWGKNETSGRKMFKRKSTLLSLQCFIEMPRSSHKSNIKKDIKHQKMSEMTKIE